MAFEDIFCRNLEKINFWGKENGVAAWGKVLLDWFLGLCVAW